MKRSATSKPLFSPEQVAAALAAAPDAQRKIHRPWGTYDSIDAGKRFQVKRIAVKPQPSRAGFSACAVSLATRP